jgi:hypothetical protein
MDKDLDLHQDFLYLDIYNALKTHKKENPQRKSITILELIQQIKHKHKPRIYNLNEIIRLLSEHIDKHQDEPPCPESEVCKIIKVKKLAMHNWRKHKFITHIPSDNRNIFYNLPILLAELKKIQ